MSSDRPVNGMKAIHPGEVLLEDFIEPLGASVEVVAEALDVPAELLRELVDGKRAVTEDLAQRLERYFGSEARGWLNLQAAYERRNRPMIVFVDFDGVMHRARVGTNIDRYFEHIGLLVAWLREHPSVQLVVSSSWREQYTLEELKDLLFHEHQDLQDRVIGKTLDLSRLHREYERSKECQVWLADNKHDFGPWVAIDDEVRRFSPFFRDDHLVLCDAAVGLTQEALDQAWRKLEKLRVEEPDRRARGQRNGVHLSPSQRAFHQALSSNDLTSMTAKEPNIKLLTDLEETQVVASITQAMDDAAEMDRLVAAAAAARRAKWTALPEEDRWVTLLLDLDEVLCVGQPYAAGALLKAFEAGEDLDQNLLDLLFSPTARNVLLHVQAQMPRRIRYVISSSWREHFNREQLELIFRSAGLAFVADNLHDGAAWRCYQAWFQPDRQVDIEYWIEKFHHGEPFVILDDRHSGGSLCFNKHFPDSHLFGRVVLCKPGVGLTMDHADDILAALGRPA